MSKMSLPRYSWSRRFDEPEPEEKIHKFSTPPILEILQLLPVAYRVGTYVYGERSNHREPIFDLNGLSLSPPHPGPHAGCPIGGIGSGCIGRGFKGEFRRFCLTPGRYIHQVITSNVFAVRIKYRNQIYSKVLSVYPPEIYVSCLYSGQWDFTMLNQAGTYHACFPIAWTIYEDVIPGIQIIIKQISPFLVENYSESCLPTAVFEVEVKVKRRRLSSSTSEQKPSKDDGKIMEVDENMEISIMFVYQNGLNEDHKQRSSKQPARKQTYSFHHQVFTCKEDGQQKQQEKNIVGIQMNSIQTALYHCPPPSATTTASATSSATAADGSSNDKDTEKEVTYSDPQAIAIATSADTGSDTNVTYCHRFQTMKSRSAVQVSLTQPYQAGSEGQAAVGGGDSSWCGGNGLSSPNVDDTIASIQKKNKNKNNNKQTKPASAATATATAACTPAVTGEATTSSSSIEKIVADTASKVILGGESNASQKQQQQQINSSNSSNNKGYSSLSTAESARVEVVDPESLAAYRIWQSFHYTGNLLDSHPVAVDDDIDNADDYDNNGEQQPQGQVKDEEEELEGARYGCALCVKKTINLSAIMVASGSAADGGDSDQQQYVSLANFSFSLAWDLPIVRYGYQSPSPPTVSAVISATAADSSTAGTARSGEGGLCTSLPRYYTRFFLPSRADTDDASQQPLSSRQVASELACYSLCHVTRWYEMIRDWQVRTIGQVQKMLQSYGLLTEKKAEDNDYSWYYSHLFNELYYLVDGGTVWLDSSQGKSNQTTNKLAINQSDEQGQGKDSKREDKRQADGNAVGVITSPPSTASTGTGNKKEKKRSEDNVVIVISQLRLQDIHEKINHHSQLLADYLLPLSSHSQTKASEVEGQGQGKGQDVAVVVVDNLADGLQSLIGQFLYYEGHEYYMYNTYDVHFYASFALFSCFPLLELSLQQDILSSIDTADDTSRMMMGEGYYRPRKTQHVVPHDVGSPSEYPWRYVNAYNFQDVSQWKDLGTKCVLQNYRNLSYLLLVNQADKIVRDRLLHYLAKSIYPILLTIMCYMEQLFDLNCDGMIENAGFPDQTYDIWTATGVSAYCGGLWISACEAMVAMADLLAEHTAAAANHGEADDEQTAAAVYSGYQTQRIYYTQLVQRARLIYLQTLWNGHYLEYDNHVSSRHHDSIMADMLAGQWYARSCGLAQGILPSCSDHDEDEKIWSCLQVIYQYNVVQFGQGSWMGAVNGMRPSRPFSLAGSNGGSIDTTCLQSREVWTGTTYALAATMLLEALHVDNQPSIAAKMASNDEASNIKRRKQQQQLIQMAFNTARGIHDGGWQKFGYWFATPEGWEKNGNYRSLGYMRPLCIWSMQYAMQLHELQEMHISSKTSVDDSSKSADTDNNSYYPFPAVELAALQALYSSTNGPAWLWRKPYADFGIPWNFTQADPNPCTDRWQGVTCTSDCAANQCQVQQVSLESYGLNGTIPSEFCQLYSLQVLDLVMSVRLFGSIPAELVDMAMLEVLHLDFNQLNGTIPVELSKLSLLQELYLNSNLLSGIIPAALGNLSLLHTLSLDNNLLSGVIPAELGNLSLLRGLYLYDNSLSGEIPAQLGKLSSLQDLDLFDNQLSGTLPAELGNLSVSGLLSLDFNKLTGTIPAEFGKLSWLTDLYLDRNQLSGTIPAEIGNLSSLLGLSLFDNGIIPSELGNLSSLEYLFLDHNQLIGTISAELGKLSTLINLDLEINQLNGTIPSRAWQAVIIGDPLSI